MMLNVIRDAPIWAKKWSKISGMSPYLGAGKRGIVELIWARCVPFYHSNYMAFALVRTV